MQSLRLFAIAVVALVSTAALCRAQDCRCLTMHDLQRMSPCQLEELFRKADIGTPPVGSGRGRQLYSTDPRHPRLKVLCANAVWKGKVVEPDGHFVNRWLGGFRAIESQYTIGPSWVDGRPAVLMEYPPGTAVFENTHDELREVGPGLYVGPLYDRFPCPILRGYIAVQVERCGGR